MTRQLLIWLESRSIIKNFPTSFYQPTIMSDPSTPVLIFLAVFFFVLLALTVHSFLHHYPNSSTRQTDFGHLSTIQWNNPNITVDEENPPIELNNLPDWTRLTIPPTPHLPPPLPPIFYDFAIYEEPPSLIPSQPHHQPCAHTQKAWVNCTLCISNVAQTSKETLRDSWSWQHQL